MLNKYNKEFKDMYRKIVADRENPLDVIKKNFHLFEKSELGVLGVSYYLSEYIKQKSNNNFNS